MMRLEKEKITISSILDNFMPSPPDSTAINRGATLAD